MKPPKSQLDAINELANSPLQKALSDLQPRLPEIVSQAEQLARFQQVIALKVPSFVEQAQQFSKSYRTMLDNLTPPVKELARAITQRQSEFQLLAQKISQNDELRKLSESANSMQSAIRSLLERVNTFTPEIQAFFEEIRQRNARMALVERLGFLPNDYFPWEYLQEEVEEEVLREQITQYYIENWGSIRDALQVQIDGYNIDSESNLTFSEALDAHGFGLYRTPPRLLFPEIERVIRIKFHDGDPNQGQASHRELREFIRKQPAGKIASVDYATSLLTKFLDDLYARVKKDQEIVKAQADPVPNRHASLHGLIVYNTVVSSLNMIFMVAFIFEIFEVLAPRASPDAD